MECESGASQVRVPRVPTGRLFQVARDKNLHWGCCHSVLHGVSLYRLTRRIMMNGNTCCRAQTFRAIVKDSYSENQKVATCSNEAGSRRRSHKRSLATLGTSRLNLKPFVWCSLSVGTMIDDTADPIILLLICIQHVISSNFGIPFACMATGVFA